MTDQPPTTFKAALLRTAQGRLIGVLLVIALVLGIVAEGISLIRSYYDMQISRIDSAAKSGTSAVTAITAAPHSHQTTGAPLPHTARTKLRITKPEDCAGAGDRAAQCVVEFVRGGSVPFDFSL
jgi:hypothetical protein